MLTNDRASKLELVRLHKRVVLRLVDLAPTVSTQGLGGGNGLQGEANKGTNQNEFLHLLNSLENQL